MEMISHGMIVPETLYRIQGFQYIYETQLRESYVATVATHLFD